MRSRPFPLAALALAVVLPARATSAQTVDAAIATAVERHAPAIIDIRHRVHQNPELGNREFKTAELIASHLRALGLDVQTGVAHTGVVATLRGGRPGPLVAVRADIDALPVTENTPYPFKSTVRTQYLGQDVGVMHACGHDVHVAVQLGVASVLAGMRDQVPGTVQFIFQPAEEGAPPGEEGGAALMLAQGLWNSAKPSAVFGLHAAAEMPVGSVGVGAGPLMASSDMFVATLIGRQAHGAQPQESVDPVVMAAQAVLALQTIRARNLSPFAPSVVTVGMIHGGERNNIIPAEVRLTGTVRTFDPTVQDAIERRMREILDGVARAGGGRYTLDYDRGYPVTVNDSALVARMQPAMLRAAGAQNVRAFAMTTGAEDFSYFARATPGYFFRLGTLKPGTTSGGHHTPTFMADDSAIPVGMRVMSSLLLDYLRGGAAPASGGQ